MNLAAIDLNLLVAFEALMAERNVTRAGHRIGLGQPAMSAALSRLRLIFKDELLVRVPGAPMRPTSKALALHPPVSEILARVRQVFDAETGFDPRRARAVFRVATGDHPASLILPRFIEMLSRTAPGVDVRLLALDKRDAFDLVDRGEIDLVIGSFRNIPKRVRRHRLYTDAFVCIARRDNPHLAPPGEMTLDAYVSVPHVLVTLAADDRGIVDEALGTLGLRRRVAVTVSDFHLVPRIVERTDMIGHLPRRIAAELVRGFDLVVMPPPLALPAWNVEVFWGGVSDAEPAAIWLRSRLFEIGQEIGEIDPSAPPPPGPLPQGLSSGRSAAGPVGEESNATVEAVRA
jgi:DNA-binding transcriptional LysR family regulator